MSVIAVYSIKGGVGKTTLSFELAWRAAQSGKRTLLWDLDLQGGAGFLLGKPHVRVPRALGAYRPGGLLRQQVQDTVFSNLFLLPADESLRVLPGELARQGGRRRLESITALLSGEFERIVLDCPPAMNEVSDQIVTAADLILVPLPPSPLSMRALEAVRHELAHNHPDPPPLLPVLSMYDSRRKLHRELLAELGPDWPVVPLASAIEQVAKRRAPVATFAGRSLGAQALEHLHKTVEKRLIGLPRRPIPPPSPPRRPAAEASPASRNDPRKQLTVWQEPSWKRALRWILRV